MDGVSYSCGKHANPADNLGRCGKNDRNEVILSALKTSELFQDIQSYTMQSANIIKNL